MTFTLGSGEMPVGRAFFVQEGDCGLHLHAAIHAIQSVHTDGRLPTIPFLCNKDTWREGSYHSAGFPIIYVSENSTHSELIAVHEIGHFIDHYGLGNGNLFASETNDSLVWEKWHKAVDASKAVRTLKERSDNTGSQTIQIYAVNGTLINHEIKVPYIQYLLQDSELFARSYAQFITKRSKHSLLQQQLDEYRKLPFHTIYPAYWEDSDFNNIETSLHDLLQEQGWIK